MKFVVGFPPKMHFIIFDYIFFPWVTGIVSVILSKIFNYIATVIVMEYPFRQMCVKLGVIRQIKIFICTQTKIQIVGSSPSYFRHAFSLIIYHFQYLPNNES